MIERDAFEGCTSLTDVTIPDTVVNIPARTFYGCTSLKDAEAHKNLKGVSPDALTGTAWENSQPDGALAFGRICYGYKGNVTNLVIPEGVSIIEPYAFLGCEQIKTVEFGPDVEEIGLYAFQNCVNLKKVEIDDAMGIVNAGAFKGCKSLKSIDFSEATLATIGYESFADCTSLEEVGTSETLSEIGDYAFANTTSGKKNDATQMICMSLHWKNKHFERHVDYIEGHEASDSIGANNRCRELVWDYASKASEFYVTPD